MMFLLSDLGNPPNKKVLMVLFILGIGSTISFSQQVKDTKFSVDRGFFDNPFLLQITSETQGANIRFTKDGSEPSLENGETYSKPILINTTTIIRAFAYKDGFEPTNIDTHSYLFLEDVIRQNGKGMPSDWGSLGTFDTSPGDLEPGPYLADYNMDQDVVNDPVYSTTILEDLKSIPTLSLSLNPHDLFSSDPLTIDENNNVLETRGIYPIGKGFERFASAEMIMPDGSTAFQIDCSLEIQGASSTDRWKTDKLSMRLKFKAPYGPEELNYPIFGDDATSVVNTVILDATNQQSWTHPEPQQQERAQFIRDQFVSDLQNAAGGIAPTGSYAFVYLNGLFWGLYWIHEFVDDNFVATYRGGKKKDYDVLRHRASNVVAGSNETYVSLMNAVNKDMSNDNNYAAATDLLDIDSFIDYILINFYAGNADWAFQNWNASFNRNDSDGRWLFHNWDAEKTFQSVSDNVTKADDQGAPTRIHQRLCENAKYRLRFADRAHRLLFNNGTLTPEVASKMYLSRLNTIDRAVVAESARWGDNRNPDKPPFTREDWIVERDRLIEDFFPLRSQVLIEQLREHQLYPNINAPVFSHLGGKVDSGLTLEIKKTDNRGLIFYTVNGEDPRTLSGGISENAKSNNFFVINESVEIKSRIYDQSGNQWSALTEAIFFVRGLKNDLKVTEIMFHPMQLSEDEILMGFSNQDQFEFLEITNSGKQTVNLQGVQFNEGIDYTFGDQNLEPGSSLVLTANRDAFVARYGENNIKIAGEFKGSLSNSGETLKLSDQFGNPLQEFSYNNNWYAQSAGGGRSLVIVEDAVNNDLLSNPGNWRPSQFLGGSPGRTEDRLPMIRISEIHYNPRKLNDSEIEAGFKDRDEFEFIELRNVGNETIQMNGFRLLGALTFNFNDYRLDPGKYLVVASNAEAFSYRYGSVDALIGTFEDGKLSDSGETIRLETNTGGLIQEFRYKSSWYEESNGQGASLEVINDLTGLHQWKKKSHWSPSSFSGGTPGFPKIELSDSPIRISELMFNPMDSSDEEKIAGLIDNDDFEFIEFTNISLEPHNLEGYELLGAVRHKFGNYILGPGQKVLVVNRLKAFRERHGSLPKIVGEYDGNLSNSSERFVLRDPSGASVLDFIYSGEWYDMTDGNGYSLTPVMSKDQSLALASEKGWRPSRDVGGSPGNDSDHFFGWVWKNFSNSSALDSNISGAFEDPDMDGLTNIVEYALSCDPLSKELNYFANLVDVEGETYLTFTYSSNLDAPDIDIVLEFSRDLKLWSDANSITVPYILNAVDDAKKEITVITKDPISNIGPQYFRLNIKRS